MAVQHGASVPAEGGFLPDALRERLAAPLADQGDVGDGALTLREARDHLALVF